LNSTSNITTTANIAANYFIGNGSLLTGIDATSIQNGNSNVKVYANANVATSVNGVANVLVVTDTGLNITGLISANGNITGGNVNAAGLSLSSNVVSNLSVTGEIAGANVTTPGLVSATGNITGGNLITSAAISAGSVSASGNITGGNLNAAGLSLSSNVVSNLNVTGNVASGNVTTPGLISATGNVTSGNVNTGNLSLSGNIISPLNVTGNATSGNIISIADISGVSVSASGNVTGANVNGTTISATGNVQSANVNATTISAIGNINGGNVNTNTIVGTSTTVKSTGDLTLSTSGNVVVNSYINGVTTPVQDSDAANKAYVDSVAQGLDVKASVVYATAAALPAYTYNNGTSGVGATITANANGALSIDGSTPSAGARVLIKNEVSANEPYNGIYVVTTVGSAGAAFVLTRATDFDNGSPSGEIPGAFTFVEAGSTNADTGWVCTTNAPVTMGTTNIVFAQFSGAGQYTANTSAGLSLIGTQFNAKVDENTTAFDGTGNIIVKAGANLTTPNIGAATGTSLSTTGNITGNVLIGSTISTTGNVIAGNVNTGDISLSGNVISALNVTGNATAGNIISVAAINGASVSASGNVTGANVNGTTVSATGNVNGGNVITSGAVSAASVSASGNITAGNISTSGASGNITGANVISAVTLSASGNVVAGNLNAAGLSLSSNVVSALNVTGDIAGGNVTTPGLISQPQATSLVAI
jgi:hypothetical protein